MIFIFKNLDWDRIGVGEKNNNEFLKAKDEKIFNFFFFNFFFEIFFEK